MTHNNTTICAISTPPGTGGIAVARISGPRAIAIADTIWKGRSLAKARSHTAHYGEITDTDGTILDTAVATIFRAPRSYTGEDTVEFSVHGSTYIQQQLITALTTAGAEPAGPGEFTKRAFLNGKLGLTEAEAVADMIAADSKAAHTMATNQLKGHLADKLNQIRSNLIHLSSLIELQLDFSEEDVEIAPVSTLLNIATRAKHQIDTLASTFKDGNAIKKGITVAIIGSPNAGKSTLLNSLIHEDRAIVSPIKGTTRDTIEATIAIGGVTFRFIDTAGLRTEISDPIERLGIDRTLEKLAKSSIIIWLIDPCDTKDLKNHLELFQTHLPHLGLREKRHNPIDTQSFNPQKTPKSRKSAFGSSDLASQTDDYQNLTTSEIDTPRIIAVLNKSDLGHPISPDDEALIASVTDKIISISAIDDTTLPPLHRLLTQTIPSSLPLLTSPRHLTLLLSASSALQSFIKNVTAGLSGELLAQDLHAATSPLGEITGAITTDDVLSSIFSHFCIGK